MPNKIIDKDKSRCLSAIVIMMACYGGERVLEQLVNMSSKMTIIVSFVFIIALAVCCYLINSSKNIFYGILAVLIGYKMMPPAIPALENASVDGNMLYYAIQKASVVIFVCLAVKLYRMQEKPVKISALPILACAAVVPFVTEIGTHVGYYLMGELGGSMIYTFVAQFASYFIATAIVLGVAYESGYESMRLVADFEYVALGINILRRLGTIAGLVLNHEHISKSLFCWIAIYAICIVATAFITKAKKKTE